MTVQRIVIKINAPDTDPIQEKDKILKVENPIY